MTNRIKFIALCCLLISSTTIAQARTLQQILQSTIDNNPKLSEAIANERIATSRLEQTAVSRWPVFAATGGQRVYSSAGNSGSGFSPALKGTWTLYDFGKNDAQIDSDLLKVDYFTQKTQETAEELIYEIAGYYLDAYKSKMSLDISKENLERHHELVRMLKIIVKYDSGRRSELTQARSRLLQVESDIVNYQRSLGLSLLRIAPFLKRTVSAKELSDPFSDLTSKSLIKKYKTSEKDLQLHPSYIAQQMELNRISADLIVAKKRRLPKVDLVGVASRNESSVYLNFDVDVFNRNHGPSVDEKRYEIEAAQAQLEQIQRNLIERSRLAELKMKQDETRLYIAKNQIKELKQVAMDYEDQFSIAKRSLLDVVNAYRELAGIELFKVDTQYDLMIAKLDYLSAVGSLRQWSSISANKISRHPILLADDTKKADARKNISKNDGALSPPKNLNKSHSQKNDTGRFKFKGLKKPSKSNKLSELKIEYISDETIANQPTKNNQITLTSIPIEARIAGKIKRTPTKRLHTNLASLKAKIQAITASSSRKTEVKKLEKTKIAPKPNFDNNKPLHLGRLKSQENPKISLENAKARNRIKSNNKSKAFVSKVNSENKVLTSLESIINPKASKLTVGASKKSKVAKMTPAKKKLTNDMALENIQLEIDLTDLDTKKDNTRLSKPQGKILDSLIPILSSDKQSTKTIYTAKKEAAKKGTKRAYNHSRKKTSDKAMQNINLELESFSNPDATNIDLESLNN